MTLGLKRGVVELADHGPEWEIIAAETIRRLWDNLGSMTTDIQHVGSTSIKGIKAKSDMIIIIGGEPSHEFKAI